MRTATNWEAAQANKDTARIKITRKSVAYPPERTLQNVCVHMEMAGMEVTSKSTEPDIAMISPRDIQKMSQ